MLWLSAVVLLVLTLYAGWTALQLNIRGDPARLRSAYLTAAVLGAIGTLCTFLAALI
jgi:hypothetical protein